MSSFVALPKNNNSVYLQSSFITGSQAAGVLYALLHVVNESVNYSKSVYLTVSEEDAENGVIIQRISSGFYVGLAYDIEHNGCMQSYGLPSIIVMFHIVGASQTGRFLIIILFIALNIVFYSCV